jgi:NhaA family Na+:H+ antiporter
MRHRQIPFAGDALRVFVGVAIGLTIWKPIGILAVPRLATRFGAAALPKGVQWSHITVIGVVGAIGFTMAVFIAQLASPGTLLKTAKLAILCGCGLTGALSLVACYRILKADHSPGTAMTVISRTDQNAAAVSVGRSISPHARRQPFQ